MTKNKNKKDLEVAKILLSLNKKKLIVILRKNLKFKIIKVNQ
jgi:hypothetical protein